MKARLEKHNVHSLKDGSALQSATEEIYKEEFYEGKTLENCGPLSNMPVAKAKEKSIELLHAANKWDHLYEPSRKAVTRAGNPIVVAVLADQWFLDYSSKEWKAKAHACIESMRVFPQKFEKTLNDAIDWLEKRPCTRKRGLGTPLPMASEWMIEPLSDSTLYMLFYLAIVPIRESLITREKLDETFWDAAIYGKNLPDGDARSALAQEIHGRILYWYPNDQRHTAPAHIQNHTSFWILHHVTMFEKEWWPGAATFNDMLNRNGQKMSKSKGNVISVQEASQKYGADLLRTYMISSSTLERVADWKDDQVPQVKNKLEELERVLLNAIQYIKNPQNAKIAIHILDEDAGKMKLVEGERNGKQFWLKERLVQRMSDAYEAYAEMDFKTAAQNIFFDTLNDIKLFRKTFGEDEGFAVSLALKRWLIMISPIAPFMAEELWKEAGFKGFVSAQTLSQPEAKIVTEVEEQVQFIERVLGDIERVRRLAKGNPKTGYIYSASEKDTQWLTESLPQLEKYSNLKMKLNDAHDPLGKKAKAQAGKPALYFE